VAFSPPCLQEDLRSSAGVISVSQVKQYFRPGGLPMLISGDPQCGQMFECVFFAMRLFLFCWFWFQIIFHIYFLHLFVEGDQIVNNI